MKSKYPFKNPFKRIAVYFFDLAGNLIFFPLRFYRALPDAEIKKVLAVRLDHLGDAVMTQPALTALRRRFPKAKIDLLVSKEAAPLFKKSAEMDQVISFSKNWFSREAGFLEIWKETNSLCKLVRNERYDAAFDFRGDLRTILFLFFAGIKHRVGYGLTGGGFLLTECKNYRHDVHQVMSNMRLVGDENMSRDAWVEPFTYSREDEDMFFSGAGNFLSEDQGGRFVIHPGAGYASKRWAPLNYAELVKRLLEGKAKQIVIVGSESERQYLDCSGLGQKVVDLRGKTSLVELLVLLDHSDFFVGNDSGPAHLAASQGLAGVILFSGTNDVRFWHPWSKRFHIVRHEVPCSPCHSDTCPLGHHDCMTKITVDRVLGEIEKTLSQEALSEGRS